MTFSSFPNKFAPRNLPTVYPQLADHKVKASQTCTSCTAAAMTVKLTVVVTAADIVNGGAVFDYTFTNCSDETIQLGPGSFFIMSYPGPNPTIVAPLNSQGNVISQVLPGGTFTARCLMNATPVGNSFTATNTIAAYALSSAGSYQQISCPLSTTATSRTITN